jgi:protoporphyrinogen/coproporphyrinogen III oxidase
MRVLVVGGGLTGLATAWYLREHAEVTVLEAADRIGGQVRTVDLAGARMDVGADAMLARQPEGVELARELGLGDDLVEPLTGSVWLWVRGRLRPLPDATVMGAPTDLRALVRSGVVPPAGVLRAALEPLVPRHDLGEDRAVGDLVTERFGRAVTDLLVDPLLSGVYAGAIDRLSTAATAPPLWAAARDHRRMTAGLRAHRRRTAGVSGPVFNTVEGGLGRLVDALGSALGDRVRTGVAATKLEKYGEGWRVTTDDGPVDVEAVVIALPAAAAARLIGETSPEVTRTLGEFRTASVAVTALAYDLADAAGVVEGSGFLVPRSEGRLVKAATWSSRKWPHLATAERFLVRASVGRVDDPRGLELDDEELAHRVDAEVREAMGLPRPARERRVVRWTDAMPQYEVGHLQRVARVREALQASGPGLHLGGAAFDGIGIPARVRDARRLAAEVLEDPGSNR